MKKRKVYHLDTTLGKLYCFSRTLSIGDDERAKPGCKQNISNLGVIMVIRVNYK